MATKTFDHAVIFNGTLYPANTPIEVKEEKKKGKSKTDGTQTDETAEENK